MDMKKILLSFALIAVILISSFSFPIYAFSVPKDLKNEYGLLESIGVFENANINDNSIYITRAQFVVALYNLFRVSGVSFPQDSVFKDVKNDYFAYNQINSFKQLDYVSGVENDMFSPEENIKMQHAIKILVSALGNKPAAEGRGGNPKGYIEIAKTLGIWKASYQYDDLITKENLVSLLYDTLFTYPLEITGIDGDNIKYETDKEETVLSKYYDIYSGTGIVSEVNPKGIDTDAEPCATIGGVLYKIGSSDVYDYLGCEVEFYYQLNDKSGEKSIVCALYSTDSEILKIESEDIIDYKNNVYYYCDDTKDKTASVNADADFYYNGEKTNYSKELAKPEYGSVTLVRYSTQKGAGYSAVIIEDNKYAVLKNSADSNNSLIFEQSVTYPVKNGFSFDYVTKTAISPSLSSDFYYIITDESNNEKSLSDLQSGMAVILNISPNGNGVRIRCCDKKVTGKISEIADDYKKVKIGSEEYEIRYALIDNDKIFLGLNAEFYLDADGKIIYLKNNSNGYKRGFAVRFFVPEDKREKVKTVIFDVDDKGPSEISVSEKVKIDGVSKEIKTQADAQYLQSICRRSFTTSATSTTVYKTFEFLQYKLNADGELSEINRIGSPNVPDYKRINTVEADMSELIVRHSLNTIGDRAVFSSGTIYVSIPYTAQNTEEYLDNSEYYIGVRTKYLLSNDYKIGNYCDLYYFDDDMCIDAIVKFGFNLKTDSANDILSQYRMVPASFTELGIVKKLSKTILDGETTDKISFITLKGEEKEYIVSPKYALDIYDDFSLAEASLETGDVFAYLIKDDMVGNFVKVYDASEKDVKKAFLGAPLSYLDTWSSSPTKNVKVDEKTCTSGSYSAKYRLTAGSVYEIKNGIMLVSLGNTTDNSNLAYFDINNAPILVYEIAAGKERVRVGSEADIKTVSAYGNEASKTAVYIRSGNLSGIVIFNY